MKVFPCFQRTYRKHLYHYELKVSLYCFPYKSIPLAAVALIATGDKRIAFDDLSATGTPAVPEPATLALLLAGGAALLARGGKARRV